MTIRLETSGPLAEIVIDRADKHNSFNLAMWQQLPELLDQAARNSELRLLVLRSATPGGAFCAGADIAEMLGNREDPDWRAENQAAINRAQYELTRHRLPTLAFIEGACVGGGCGLALACDIRLATINARFGITPAKLGLVYPLHDVKLLTDLLGPGQAKRLLFTGKLIDAHEALRIGLIEDLVEEPDTMIGEILAASPNSNRDLKRFVRRVLDGEGEEDAESLKTFADAFKGPDFLEGTRAFVEKRKPEF